MNFLFLFYTVIFLMLLLLSGLLFCILRSKTGLCKLWVLKKWCCCSWSAPWSITFLGRKESGDHFFRNKFNILWMATSYTGVESTFFFCAKKDEDTSCSCKNRYPFPLLPYVLLFFLFWITLSVISFLRHSILITEKKNQMVIGELHSFLHSNILTF